VLLVREPTLAERLNDEVWTGGDLLERLERRDKFFVLDVRNRDEFERFRLEGSSPVPAVNIPYFEMLELGGKDEMLDSVVAYVERDLADQLPSDLPILAVCANLKGGMKAWGEHYATRALVEGPGLAIYQLSWPAPGCLSYMVASTGKRD
jgi:rhodanese-related sulfurtransferase